MYFYNANALAIGGRLIRPFSKMIPSQADSSLPITGGSSTSRVENFNFEGLISFRFAQTDLAGGTEPRNGIEVSTARMSVVIEQLNILNMFTAERVVTRLAAEYRPGDREPSIITIGSHFDNLRIAGHAVDVESDHQTFADFDTYEKLQQAYQFYGRDRNAILEVLMGRSVEIDEKSPQHLKDIWGNFHQYIGESRPELKRVVLASFVKNVRGIDGPEIKNWGPVIVAPQFGTIYLGEITISEGYRRINMFRLELGSPDAGSIVGASGALSIQSFPHEKGVLDYPQRRILDYSSKRPLDVYDRSVEMPLFSLEKTKSAAKRADTHPKKAVMESPRFVQADLFRLAEGTAVREDHGFVVGYHYQLDVFIGPQGEGAITSDEIFEEKKLNWREKKLYTLKVIFAELEQWKEPFISTLELPRMGKSTTCRFMFSPTKIGDFCGRVTVYHRGRILQTALLKAPVVENEASWSVIKAHEPLRFAVEAEIHPDLTDLDRRRFDACLVLNRTSRDNRGMTAASEHGAYIASLNQTNKQLEKIANLLKAVALNRKAYRKGIFDTANAKLLCDLAKEGNALYRTVVIDYINRHPTAKALREGQYIQIVSAEPDAVLPLEFIYHYPIPQEGAAVCKNALQALETGECPSSCEPTQSPAPHVCPLGFWGLVKVIERHVHVPELSTPARVDSDFGKTTSRRKRLSLRGASLLAASEQVSTTSRLQLKAITEAAWRDGAADVSRWEDWRIAVQSNGPVLLVVLPHADGKDTDLSLEIGGDVIRSLEINDSYVCCNPEAPPIVLLLGCDVANVSSADAYIRHIAVFRQAGSAIVLGTLATVFGDDAATVAGSIVTLLAKPAKRSPERFGEILRRVKRKAVAESLMVAMCLASFGDADWYLK